MTGGNNSTNLIQSRGLKRRSLHNPHPHETRRYPFLWRFALPWASGSGLAAGIGLSAGSNAFNLFNDELALVWWIKTPPALFQAASSDNLVAGSIGGGISGEIVKSHDTVTKDKCAYTMKSMSVLRKKVCVCVCILSRYLRHFHRCRSPTMHT